MDDPWTDEKIQRLREMWVAESPRLSGTEIGRKLGFSKNAVVGKARRIGLPSRGSPIHSAEKPGRKPGVALTPKPIPQLAPRKQFSGLCASPTACKWPVGNPGDPGFRFCKARRQPGKPYCAAHCEIAFKNDRNR